MDIVLRGKSIYNEKGACENHLLWKQQVGHDDSLEHVAIVESWQGVVLEKSAGLCIPY